MRTKIKKSANKPFVPYAEYIRSKAWQEKHKPFLKAASYRCAFTGLTIGKKVNGKYRGYNLHHMNYRNLGKEVLWVDVAPFSKLVHSLIIHGILSGFKRPSEQASYPNLAQKTFHFWCCQSHLIRAAFLAIIFINILIKLF